ncbi:CBS domain-containing protein [Natronoglycomyces albus]|uniref:CBS domain-containing protein n=1 Tax=Natronoglycomyces albus TaxID=2811108 RepID=A0A895XWL9_9ACTN|nr:CBS domain-containing protein [Natronoglycomyces albus]QSB06028.1 CBS domain-containing protein [Natronoglycomyces albus]
MGSQSVWLISFNLTERVEASLEMGRAIVAWENIGDLRGFESREALHFALAADEPSRDEDVVAAWASQLWAFYTHIRPGDLVVMCCQSSPPRVSIGRVTGDYTYDASQPPEMRHARPVEWLTVKAPVSSFGSDIRGAVRSVMGVARVEDAHIADRLAEFVAIGYDPGRQDQVYQTPELLIKAAFNQPPEKPLTVTIRALLRTWGFERRTDSAVSAINHGLATSELSTRPPFAQPPKLENEVAIVKARQSPSGCGDDQSQETLSSPRMTQPVSSIASPIVTIRLGQNLDLAMSRMTEKRFSQLAVVNDKKHLLGAVSWDSIGRARLARREPTLRDALYTPETVRPDADVRDKADVIVQHGFVFLTNDKGGVSGIITAADLADRFHAIVRPFIDIEEAEILLRNTVKRHLTLEEVKPHLLHPDAVNKIDDISFGSYEYIFKKTDLWQKLGWNVNKNHLVGLIKTVCDARNELMHFAPDPLPQSQEDAISGLLELLRPLAGGFARLKSRETK